MRIGVKHPGELTQAEIEAWRALLQGDALSSPYFSPEFNCIAGEVNPNVQVALACDDGRLLAVFPFRRGPLGYCRPPAGALCDFQGVIAAPETKVNIGEIAAQAGVAVFPYEALPADQARHGFPGAADGAETEGCAVIGLEDGYEAWRAGRARETSAFKKLEQKRRALEREGREVRVVIDEGDDAVFETLCDWKSAQLRAAGHFDIFTASSTRALLDEVRAERGPRFRGVLSALYVDGALAAAHFGMQAGAVLHYWFPGYAPEFAKSGVGKMLLEELARAGAAEGWTAIHMGDGDYSFKREFASRRIPLMRGVLRRPSLAAAAHWASERAVEAAEAAPLGPVSRLPGKAIRKLGRIADFGWSAA